MTYKFNPFTGNLDLSENNWEIEYIFDDVEERDAFFAANPKLLVTDTIIFIKDSSPPPTPGVRHYNFSKSFNSQYSLTAF